MRNSAAISSSSKDFMGTAQHLPRLAHANQWAEILIGGLVNGIDVIDFSPRVRLLIAATVIGVANPVPPVPERKAGTTSTL